MTAALELCCILGGYNMKACHAHHLLSSTKEIGSLTRNNNKKSPTKPFPCSFVCLTFIPKSPELLPSPKFSVTRTYGILQGIWLSFPMPLLLQTAAMTRTGFLVTLAASISSRQRVNGTGSGLATRTHRACVRGEI